MVAVSAEPPARSSNLQSRYARGSLWALLGYGGQQILRVLNQLILWRLLYPEAFGLMAIVNVFMIGLAMFSDVGIGPSIIQNERGDDPDYLNTAWTIQVMRGFGLFFVSLVAAIPVSKFYHEPDLALLIPAVTAGSLIVSGFNSTKLFTVTRQIAIGRLTVVELSSQAAGLVVMIGYAVFSRSIWSLVLGNAVTNIVRLVLGHAILPGIKDRFRWDPKSAHALVHFGRWIFMSTLLTFLVGQSDRLVFGKLVTMAQLGVYNVGATWATFPTQVLGHVVQSVMFPVFSRVHNDKGDLPGAYREARVPALIAVGCLTACLLAGGPTLIRFMYDKRALDAGWTIQALTVGTWFFALEMINGQALLALGRPKWIAAGSFAKLCGMVVLIPLGFWWMGFPGAVIGFTVSEVFKYCLSLIGAQQANLNGYRQDIVFSILVAVTTGLGFAAREGARHLGVATLSQWNVRVGAFVEGAIIFLVVAAVWAAAFVWNKKRTKSHLGMHDAKSLPPLELEITPSAEILPLGEEAPPASQAPELRAAEAASHAPDHKKNGAAPRDGAVSRDRAPDRKIGN
jgi:O-antigen/teichoic acid export membrane protein